MESKGIKVPHMPHSWSFCPCLVNEGGIKQVSNYCPDPGEPENGKRIGSDFRLVDVDSQKRLIRIQELLSVL